MSLCDTCAHPGRCCFGFSLNGGSFGRYKTSLEMLAELAIIVTNRDNATANEEGPAQIGLPFMPLMQRCDGDWRFWCPNLDRHGRCSDYENRPGLCKIFEPASDRLCIYWKPTADNCDGCTPYRDRPSTIEKRQEQCHPKLE